MMRWRGAFESMGLRGKLWLGFSGQAARLEHQQRELQDTEAWFRSIIESAPDGMLVADAQGIIILANEQTERMFGHPAG